MEEKAPECLKPSGQCSGQEVEGKEKDLEERALRKKSVRAERSHSDNFRTAQQPKQSGDS